MDIKIFGNPNFGDIRIAVNENGEALFCLLDVCKALELANPSQVKTRLDSSNLISVEVTTKSANRHGVFTRTTSMTYIGEANLYRCERVLDNYRSWNTDICDTHDNRKGTTTLPTDFLA